MWIPIRGAERIRGSVRIRILNADFRMACNAEFIMYSIPKNCVVHIVYYTRQIIRLTVHNLIPAWLPFYLDRQVD